MRAGLNIFTERTFESNVTLRLLKAGSRKDNSAVVPLTFHASRFKEPGSTSFYCCSPEVGHPVPEMHGLAIRPDRGAKPMKAGPTRPRHWKPGLLGKVFEHDNRPCDAAGGTRRTLAVGRTQRPAVVVDEISIPTRAGQGLTSAALLRAPCGPSGRPSRRPSGRRSQSFSQTGQQEHSDNYVDFHRKVVGAV